MCLQVALGLLKFSPFKAIEIGSYFTIPLEKHDVALEPLFLNTSWVSIRGLPNFTVDALFRNCLHCINT